MLKRAKKLAKQLLIIFPEKLRRNSMSLHGERTSYFLLRRNIHRLEKSLVYPTRSEYGGFRTFVETINIYSNLDFIDNATQLWMEEVFTSFRLNASAEVKSKIDKLLDDVSPTGSFDKKVDLKNTNLDYVETAESFCELLKNRRSIRAYSNQLVSKEKIDLIGEMVRHVPTPCNRQSYKVSFVQDKVKIDQLLDIQGGVLPWKGMIFNLAIISVDRQAYPNYMDSHSVFTEGGLVGMTLMLSMTSARLGSVALNWTQSLKSNSRVNEIIEIPSSYQTVMFIAFGYPDVDNKTPFSSKRSMEELIKIIG